MECKMSKGDSEIMKELQEKIRELTEENRRLHKKLEEKESKINELEEELNKQKEEINELKEENQKLRQEIFGLRASKKRRRSLHTNQKPKKRGPPVGELKEVRVRYEEEIIPIPLYVIKYVIKQGYCKHCDRVVYP